MSLGRAALAIAVLATAAAGPVRGATAPEPGSHGALHLAWHDTGISFGNAPRVHGLRFNWRDHGVRQVDGLNLAVIGTEENPDAVIRGIAITLWGAFQVHEMDGVGLSLPMCSIDRSRGLLLSALVTNSDDAAGIQMGGLAVMLDHSRGIQLGGLGVLGGNLSGLTVGGIGIRTQSLTGINVGGLAVIGDQRVTGINAGAIVGAGERLHGLTLAGAVLAGDLEGISVGGWNRIHGVQRGLTIGLVNSAATLRGVQIGVVNIARNNRGVFRALPVLNAHLGR